MHVNVNGLFELSANRRDLWWTTQNDITGDGRRRAQWNAFLLADVVAPSYGRLLLELSRLLTSGRVSAPLGTASPQPAARAPSSAELGRFYSLWPCDVPPEPWTTMVIRTLQLLADVAVLYTPLSLPGDVVRWRSVREALNASRSGARAFVSLEARGSQVVPSAPGVGSWVSPADAVLALSPALDIFGKHGNAKVAFSHEQLLTSPPATVPPAASRDDGRRVELSRPPPTEKLTPPSGDLQAAVTSIANAALSSFSAWAALATDAPSRSIASPVVSPVEPAPDKVHDAPAAPAAPRPPPLRLATSQPSAAVIAALCSSGVPVVEVPPALRSMLLSARVSNLEASPQFVRSFFRIPVATAVGLLSPQPSGAEADASVRRVFPCLSSAGTASEILRFVLSDLRRRRPGDSPDGEGAEEGYVAAHALPLLTSLNGRLLPLLEAPPAVDSVAADVAPRKSTDSAWLARHGVFLLRSPPEVLLWSGLSHRVLLTPGAVVAGPDAAAAAAPPCVLDADIASLLSSEAAQASLNVRVMSPELLPTLLELALPARWRGRESVPWDEGAVSMDWLASLWRYLDLASPRLACLTPLTAAAAAAEEGDAWPLIPAYRLLPPALLDAADGGAPTLHRYLVAPSKSAAVIDGSSLSPGLCEALSAAGLFLVDAATCAGLPPSTGAPRGPVPALPLGLRSRGFVHEGGGRGLLAALRSAALRLAMTPSSAGPEGGASDEQALAGLRSVLPRLLKGAPPAVRDELRRVLAEGIAPAAPSAATGRHPVAWQWRSGEPVSDLDVATLQSLPVYEVYDGAPPGSRGGGSVRAFADFLETPLSLPPQGVPEALLSRAFLRVGPGELPLARVCGAADTDEATFYATCILPALGSMPRELRDLAVGRILLDVGRLDAAAKAAAASASASLAAATAARDSRAAAAATLALQRATPFSDVLRRAAFVPNGLGALKRPSELYDPSVRELRELLNGAESFPAEADGVEGGGGASAAAAAPAPVSLRSGDALAALRSLGLQCRLSRAALLQAAQSIDAEAAGDAALRSPTLVQRARHLLRLVGDLDIAPPRAPTVDADSEGAVERPGDVATEKGGADGPPAAVDVDDDGAFMAALRRTAWMPTLQAPPHPLLPWPAPPVAPLMAPRSVRPPEAGWLCSASFGLLDGELRSPAVRAWLGWAAPEQSGSRAGGSTNSGGGAPPFGVLVPPRVVARQLAALGDRYRAAAAGDVSHALAVFVPPIYAALVDGLKVDRAGPADAANLRRGGAEFAAAARQLRDVPWVFVGDRFVPAARVALRSPPQSRPFLHALSPDLAPLFPALHLLGVRETFSLADFAAALREMPRGQPLPADALAFAVGALELLGAEPPVAAAAAGPDDAPTAPAAAAAPALAPWYVPSDELARGSVWWREAVAAAGVIFAPDAAGAMRPAAELICNDAPWLPRAAVALHASKFVHRTL